jgi:hypothetical protein
MKKLHKITVPFLTGKAYNVLKDMPFNRYFKVTKQFEEG